MKLRSTDYRYNTFMQNIDLIYSFLSAWALQSEKYWYALPGAVRQGCYGSGYNAWGVQTNQKYFSALAALAARTGQPELVSPEWALDRALTSLRFSLFSHVSGSGRCTDGSSWGHTWISALGIERMMQGVYRIENFLTSEDRSALERLLISESDWLLKDYSKNQQSGVKAGLWDESGQNQPESNIWNGALLWRTAVTLPNHPHAADWQEKAHQFLINGVSIPADAEDESVVAGKSVRSRHIGANFFPSYALDHHGYLNIGYMVICASNAAMLHFDLKMKGLARPESLDHHQADLWQVIRRLVFQNGRLARIGGDTRVRYAYCQDYLLPALLYAADHLGDRFAVDLASQQVGLISKEAQWNGDGSFFSRRLEQLAKDSPYYYTRLESDRACALAQLCAYLPLLDKSTPLPSPAALSVDTPAAMHKFEESVSGFWAEAEHGAVLHRSPRRMASFAWRAQGIAQGMCQSPRDGHLTDWEGHLCGQIEFVHHPHPQHPSFGRQRRLISHQIQPFTGGFLTYGCMEAGADIELAEGWRGQNMAWQFLAFAALPDDQTVLAIEFARMNDARGCLRQIQGLHFNLANDLYNDFTRELQTAERKLILTSPAVASEILNLPERYCCIDQHLGIVALSSNSTLHINRSSQRRAGAYRSLYVEEITVDLITGPYWAGPNETLLDCSWAILSGASWARTLQACASGHAMAASGGSIRWASIQGNDGKTYGMAVNIGMEAYEFVLPRQSSSELWRDVANGQICEGLILEPGSANLFVS